MKEQNHSLFLRCLLFPSLYTGIKFRGQSNNYGRSCRSPRPTSNLNLRTSLVLRTDNLLAGKQPSLSLGRLPAIVLSSAVALWKLIGEGERGSGIGLKLFGFIPDSVFTLIPNHCSESSRNRVHFPPESPPG